MNHLIAIARYGLSAMVLVALLAATGCFEQPGSLLDLRTSPSGARIELDGVYQGDSPIKLKVVPGQHLVMATRDGFLETRGNVNVQPTGTTRFDMSLRPLFGLVLAESFPTGSEVLVDGMTRGKTPVLMTDLPAGQHRLLIKKEGYESKETLLNIQAETDRQPKLISLELRSLLVAIKITSAPDKAKVYLAKADEKGKGSEIGESPQSIQNILAGKYRVRVEFDGYEPYEQEVEVAGKEEYRVHATLQEKYARIKIDTDPPGGEVFLNEEARGKTPVALGPLHEGDYTIRIVKPNYPETVRKVTLKKGEDLQLTIPLERRVGVLQVITIPAGVDVFVDGEKRGTTVSVPSVQYSTPLVISDVLAGQRIVKLIKPGFAEISVPVEIIVNKVIPLTNIQLRRLYIPDTAIATKDGRTLRGLISRVENDGTVHFETAPGIFVDIPPDDIVSKKPITPAGK
ncbi:MAG: PEGA domain-containing protein [Verrucomicrobia bacterium]|nr:PEGA domain-containing protein [Verrucomicrobiota bacterium]MCX6908499.1 PEGA domain-containing protein [Verrucomicrobiota bacterium]